MPLFHIDEDLKCERLVAVLADLPVRGCLSLCYTPEAVSSHRLCVPSSAWLSHAFGILGSCDLVWARDPKTPADGTLGAGL